VEACADAFDLIIHTPSEAIARAIGIPKRRQQGLEAEQAADHDRGADRLREDAGTKRSDAEQGPADCEGQIAGNGADREHHRRVRVEGRRRLVGDPRDGEGLEPQVSAEHHGPDECGDESDHAEPAGLVNAPSVGADQGDHEREEAGHVDPAADLEDGVGRRGDVVLRIERQHHQLRDDDENPGREGHRPCETGER
jgi:hypothetical protein